MSELRRQPGAATDPVAGQAGEDPASTHRVLKADGCKSAA
jgi:hypothetical protein